MQGALEGEVMAQYIIPRLILQQRTIAKKARIKEWTEREGKKSGKGKGVEH